jgi:hypothetical protein
MHHFEHLDRRAPCVDLESVASNVQSRPASTSTEARLPG